MDYPDQQAEQPGVVNDLDNFFNISFDSVVCDQLRQCSFWAKVVAISSFAGYLVVLYLWLFGHGGVSLSGAMIILLGVALVGGGVTANWYLYRFAAKIGRGVGSLDAVPVNQGFGGLRQYFKIAAIVMIVDICIFIAAFLYGMISALHANL
jgi:hypothetical protein